MMSFFVKSTFGSAYSIVGNATKSAMLETARATTTFGIVYGSYYLYNQTNALMSNGLFKNSLTPKETPPDHSENNITKECK